MQKLFSIRCWDIQINDIPTRVCLSKKLAGSAETNRFRLKSACIVGSIVYGFTQKILCSLNLAKPPGYKPKKLTTFTY